MTTDDLSVERTGPVATLRLDRPAKRNAITRAMWTELPARLVELAAAADVRVLVVRGAGGTFSAGADISELDLGPDPEYAAVNFAAEEALAGFPKPTVAAIQGHCVGGGCSLATACDLRVADTTARLGITPARLGIVYPANALGRVTQLIGPAAARWLLYTGDLVDADWALRTGLVDAVHPPETFDAALTELTTTMAERSLLTQQASKEMVAAVLRDGAVPLELAERWTKEARAAGGDAAEGIAAFHERRPARFRWPATD